MSSRTSAFENRFAETACSTPASGKICRNAATRIHSPKQLPATPGSPKEPPHEPDSEQTHPHQERRHDVHHCYVRRCPHGTKGEIADQYGHACSDAVNQAAHCICDHTKNRGRSSTPSGSVCIEVGLPMPPRFHSLIAQLVAVRGPKDTATESIIAHGFDDCLHRDPRFAGSGWHADNPAPLGAGPVFATQQVPDIRDDGPLIAMKLRKRVRASDFQKRIALHGPLACPFGGKPERLYELDSPWRPGPL